MIKRTLSVVLLAYSGLLFAADPARITNQGVGTVTIGMPIAQAVAAAKVLGPVESKAYPSGEGEQELRYLVRMEGKTALVLEENQGKLWRITIVEPRLRDDVGIGVGSTLAQVQAKYPQGKVFPGEGGACWIGKSAPGRSFCLTTPQPKPAEKIARILIWWEGEE